MNNERLKNIIRSANNIINRVESPDFKLDKGAMEERMAELKSNTEIPLITAEQVKMMNGELPMQNHPQHQQTHYPQQNTSNLNSQHHNMMLEQQYNQMFNQMYGEKLNNPATQKIQQPTNTHMNEVVVKNSKLPDFIKEAMLKDSIPQLNPSQFIQGKGSFSIEDVADLIDENQRQAAPQIQSAPQNFLNITEQTIRNIVREEVVEMMARYFGNTMNEDLEKKLIQKLIKEGKIKTVTKKKTN